MLLEFLKVLNIQNVVETNLHHPIKYLCSYVHMYVDLDGVHNRTFIIKGRKDILRVLKPAFKEQICILRLENAQIANLSLIFAIFLAQKCSKQGNKG